MGLSKRKKLYKKISGFKRKGYPWAKRLDWYMWGAFTQERAYKMALSETQIIQELRSEYSQETEKIYAGEISFGDLENLSRRIEKKYNKLLPSEISTLSNLIANGKQKAANNTLKDEANAINQLPVSISSLQSLETFKRLHQNLYAYASENVQMDVDAQVQQKKQNILSELVERDKEELNNMDLSSVSIETLNKAWNQINLAYGPYQNEASVKELFQFYSQQKTQFVTLNASKIAEEVGRFNSPTKLKELHTYYLSNTSSNLTLQKLSTYITERAEENERIIQAEHLRLKRLEEARLRLIATNQQEVARLRAELRIQYESNLPTFEELHFILQSYLTLINPSGKYNVSDAKKFIRLVEDQRYMRKNPGNISGDDELFENSRGFKIHCSAYTSFDSENLANVELKIPNASKEMFRLYAMELSSGYRNLLTPYLTPETMPADGDFFINSGRTIYSMEMDEEGMLILQAQRNSFAEWPIIAERTSPNTLKVTSFTTATDVSVKAGQKITIRATGKITLGLFAGSCDPNGINQLSNYNLVKQFNHGSLIGKIGPEGEWFSVGRNTSFIAPKTGVIYLQVNDNDVNNNEGYFTVSHQID